MKKAAAETGVGLQVGRRLFKNKSSGIRVAMGVGWGGDRNTIPGGTRSIIRSMGGMSTANRF